LLDVPHALGERVKVTCAICGYQGEVENALLFTTPMLAFFSHRRPRENVPDVWICDVHKSEVRDQFDSKTNSLEPTDHTESKKGHEDVQANESFEV
jgi:hypothetical protein